jgi:hypothetical protein
LNQPNAINSLNRDKDKALPLSGPALKELLASVLAKGLPFRFKARGFSMSPFIKDGDVLTVSPLDNVLPRIGDVVIFIHPVNQNVVVHRVVAKRGNSYLVKGDNSPGLGTPLPRENVLGRLDRLERNGKRALLGLGPERLLIAFLTRGVFLHRILIPLWQSVRSRLKKPSI